ncbi:MAG TPA: hypothetical protein VGR28_06455 [Candidatus Thermoplasmatota archaeon]|jgi:hypothetical protein|nr:hypothetical protein [Candidatus Thermoplasmatota archaeon]
MGLEDVLQPAGLLNLITLLVAGGLWWTKRPQGALGLVLLFILAGTGFHFLTDLTFDLGTDGEHLLMHVVVLASALAVLAA